MDKKFEDLLAKSKAEGWAKAGSPQTKKPTRAAAKKPFPLRLRPDLLNTPKTPTVNSAVTDPSPKPPAATAFPFNGGDAVVAGRSSLPPIIPLENLVALD